MSQWQWFSTNIKESKKSTIFILHELKKVVNHPLYILINIVYKCAMPENLTLRSFSCQMNHSWTVVLNLFFQIWLPKFWNGLNGPLKSKIELLLSPKQITKLYISDLYGPQDHFRRPIRELFQNSVYQPFFVHGTLQVFKKLRQPYLVKKWQFVASYVVKRQ